MPQIFAVLTGKFVVGDLCIHIFQKQHFLIADNDDNGVFIFCFFIRFGRIHDDGVFFTLTFFLSILIYIILLYLN